MPGRIAETRAALRAWSARRVTIVAAVLAVAGVAAGTGLVLSSTGAGQVSATPPAGSVPVVKAAVATARASAPSVTVPTPAVAGSTVLATVLATSPQYTAPGKLGTGTVPATWYDRPSVLPVLATKPGWVEVRLAQRPDGSVAWLSADDVSFSITPASAGHAGTCVSTAAGLCTFDVDSNRTYTITQTGAPAGWFIDTDLDAGAMTCGDVRDNVHEGDTGLDWRPREGEL